MKTRILLSLLIAITLVFTSSFSVFALPYSDTTYNGEFPYDTDIEYYDEEDYLVDGDGPLCYLIPSNDKENFIVTGCGDDVKSIIIPSVFSDKLYHHAYFNGLAVGAFKNKPNLTSIIFGEGMETLKTGCIENCKNLKTVSFYDDTTAIEERAIVDSGLTHILLPIRLKELDGNAFEGCTNLSRIEVTDGNKHYKSVDNHIFSSDMSTMVMYGPYDAHTNTKDVMYNVPDGVKNIAEKCFYNCDIDKLVFPTSLENIEENAISGDYLDSVYIPDSVKSIGQNAIPKNVEILCPKGSYAEFYAATNGNECSEWDEKRESTLIQQSVIIANKKSSLAYSKDLFFNVGASALTTLSYRSSNDNVATVSSSGKVTINGVGSATITVNAAKTDKYNSASDSFVLKVTPGINSITGGSNSYSKYVGTSTFNLGLKANTKLQYSSNDINVAKVDSSGNVSILNPGRATISVTTEKDARYEDASREITVQVSMQTPSLKAKGAKKKVKLTWSKVNGASGYKVYCYNKKKKKYTLRVSKNSTIKSVTHKGLKRRKKYKYYVVAFRNSNGVTYYSPRSSIVTCKTK